MKKILFLCLTLVTNDLLAQSLDIKDLRFCLYSSPDLIDPRLEPKGFVITTRQTLQNPLRDNRWLLKNAKNAAVCTLTMTEIGREQLVSLTINSADIFSEIMNQLPEQRFQYKNTVVIKGQAIILFTNGEEELAVKSCSDQHGGNFYTLELRPLKHDL